jgi:ATP-dependent DNA helicase RecG
MALANPAELLESLRSHPAETEWFEFKKGNFDPEEIGEYVSALANSAMLHDKRHAYLVYGIDNATHEIVGTDVHLGTEKVKGELFESWLSRYLEPRINIAFEWCNIGDKHVEIVCIEPAYTQPVKFRHLEYIRINSVKRRLDDFPLKERTLWQLTSRYSFEEGIAASHFSKSDLTAHLHCGELAKLIYHVEDLPLETIIKHFLQDGLLVDDMQGGYDVTNLLALAAARRLPDFKTISHKALRVITYKTNTKLTGIEDVTGVMGYAVAFPKILRHIHREGGSQEVLEHGKMRRDYVYPEKAVREFLANALIHQDFIAPGNPVVEIHADKIQFTNPGASLVPQDRWIDAPPKSRNERLASLMRSANHCESRGSGVDRAIWAIERAVQAPPLFAEADGSTVVTIFKNTNFAAMSKEDRVRACDQHATLRYIASDPMSNSTLRARLGLNKNQSSPASNVISDAIAAGKIRPLDIDQGNRFARYVPAWA